VIWLGSFNALGKLTAATLALWAKVLHTLPEAKLLLKTKEFGEMGNRQGVLDIMAGHGIEAQRIEFQDWSATPDWRSIWPITTGSILRSIRWAAWWGSTTCDALWMGVPVITLEGDRLASRVTDTMLNAVGHPEWVSRSEADYIDKVWRWLGTSKGARPLRSASERAWRQARCAMRADWPPPWRMPTRPCSNDGSLRRLPLRARMTAGVPKSLSPEAALQQAIAHHQAGRLQEAEQLYRAILKAQPDQPTPITIWGFLQCRWGNTQRGCLF